MITRMPIAREHSAPQHASYMEQGVAIDQTSLDRKPCMLALAQAVKPVRHGCAAPVWACTGPAAGMKVAAMSLGWNTRSLSKVIDLRWRRS